MTKRKRDIFLIAKKGHFFLERSILYIAQAAGHKNKTCNNDFNIACKHSQKTTFRTGMMSVRTRNTITICNCRIYPH